MFLFILPRKTILWLLNGVALNRKSNSVAAEYSWTLWIGLRQAKWMQKKGSDI